MAGATAVLITATPALSIGPVGWVLLFDLFTLLGLHGRRATSLRARSSLFDELAAVLAFTVISAAAVITLRSVVAPDLDVAGQTLRPWLYVAASLLAVRTVGSLSERRAWRRNDATNALIVGAGVVGRQVAARLLERPEWGLRPVGYVDKDPLPVDVDRLGLPVLGASWDLEELVERHGVRTVVFTFSSAPHHVYLDLIKRSHELRLQVLLVPRLFEQMNGQVDLAHVGGMPLLHVTPVGRDSWKLSAKYAVDRVVAALALVAVAPVMGAIALAVRLTSRGPVLFRQRRMGLDGREFEMLKFRTMTGSPEADGEADASWVASAGYGGIASTGANAVRVAADRRTPLGHVLRRFSLDELPQLFNVLRGEMSLVGPRPERASLARSFQHQVDRYGERHRVKGGVTGWAQVQGFRGETSLADRVEWDNHYIENWSPWFDVKILFMTVSAVLGRHRGGP